MNKYIAYGGAFHVHWKKNPTKTQGIQKTENASRLLNGEKIHY